MEQKTMPTQQDAMQHHARLMKVIEETFASYGWKGGVKYVEDAPFTVTIPVKFPKSKGNPDKK
ncbi:MAG: hypothetical protein Q4C01_03000 [Clostridia bacterium]|nr:hypothetical protein [Clostridia bacterium]